MSKYETLGGHVTRGETYSKIIFLLDELRDQCLIMGHLHKTEDSNMDRLLAKGWYGIEEMLRMFRAQIVELAQGKL